MSKMLCETCGYVYDPAEEGVAWADVPADYQCPWCGEGKEVFVPQED